MAIQDLLFCCRAAPDLMSAADAWRFAAAGGRTACIAALDGHFAGVAAWRRLGRSYAGPFAGIRLLSVLMPVDELVARLNAIAPAALVAYPSVLELLSHEQRAGRLTLAPVLIMTGGECLDPAERETVESAFGCRVREIYGCSEFEYLAFDCEHDWLHLNADWAMLEPVDAAGCAVPAGTVSHSCLLTNLANRVQPLIRYDLGDRILVRPDRCPCGCPLPAIRVQGRDTEILTFTARGGRRVEVMPMALVDLLEEIPGIGRFQVVQTGPDALQIGFEASLGRSADSVWHAIERSLQGFIAGQGLGHVRLERSATPPLPDPRSGKFRQICAKPGLPPRIGGGKMRRPRRPSAQT